MKNKDVLAMEKAKIVEKMNQAIKDDDAKAFSEAFTELCQKIEDNVLEQAKEMLVEQDATILAQRGVRQLTSKEKQYYEKIIEAMRSTDPKQALNDVEVVMPETIIDSVFDELQTNHPLLSKLNATTVTGLTRMMMNTNGEQKAAWGKLTAKIIEELTSGFKEVDVTQEKLSAFLPVSRRHNIPPRFPLHRAHPVPSDKPHGAGDFPRSSSHTAAAHIRSRYISRPPRCR